MENAHPEPTANEPAHPQAFVCPNCGYAHIPPGAEPPRELTEHKLLSLFNTHGLFLRNFLAVIAAGLFMLSLLSDNNHLLLKAIAYAFGALAYLGEILLMTDCFRHLPPKSELLMPYLFGGMYIILGISYALEHF